MWGPRQPFFQCGPETPKGWAPLIKEREEYGEEGREQGKKEESMGKRERGRDRGRERERNIKMRETLISHLLVYALNGGGTHNLGRCPTGN